MQREARLSADVSSRLHELDHSYYELRDVEGGGFEVAANTYATSPEAGNGPRDSTRM